MKTRLIAAMLCAVVLLSLTACKKNTLPPLAERLEPPFLQDVERVPLNSMAQVNPEKYAERYEGDLEDLVD